MAPLKKIYLEELARIQDRINNLFEQALLPADYDERDGELGLPGTWAPAVDVLETEDSYLLFAELPGVAKEDIQLQVREQRLELSGHRRSLGESRNFLRMERSYGPFRRTFDLGVPVDAESISASFDHGTLRVAIPKRPATPALAVVVTEEL
jgi:HSP20 family protein